MTEEGNGEIHLPHVAARDPYTLVDPMELLENGVVALINLLVLWPRGYALAVATEIDPETLDQQEPYLTVRRIDEPIVDYPDGILEQRVRAFALWHERRMTDIHGA